MTIPLDAPLPGRLELPTRTAGVKRPVMRSLFGIAPGGACHATPVAGGAVGSYPTVSPSPRRRGGFFSVALSVGSLRPGVTRHRCFRESGLSSNLSARGHPAFRAGLTYACARRPRQARASAAAMAQSVASSGPECPDGTSASPRGEAAHLPRRDNRRRARPRETRAMSGRIRGGTTPRARPTGPAVPAFRQSKRGPGSLFRSGAMSE
jgi:hypothetical protein